MIDVGLQRKSDQTITTRVTFDVHSARPLPIDRVRAWLRHGVQWSAVSLHPDYARTPGEQKADEEGWEYVHVDISDATGVDVIADLRWVLGYLERTAAPADVIDRLRNLVGGDA